MAALLLVLARACGPGWGAGILLRAVRRGGRHVVTPMLARVFAWFSVS